MCLLIRVTTVIALLSITTTPSLSAHILGVVPTPSYSHQIVFQPLWRELSLRGHQVTVLTPNPLKEAALTNLTEIDLSFSYEQWNKINLVDMAGQGLLELFSTGIAIVNDLIDQQLQHPEVQALLKNKNNHFDLVIAELRFPVMFAFSVRFDCPFIGISSLDAPSYNLDLIGNPSHPVLNPDFMLPFFGELTFLERLTSVLFHVFLKFYEEMHVVSLQPMVSKHFGPEYPPLVDIARNVSMLFVNTDPVFHPIRPLLPSVVQIGGGTHLKPAQPLPKDLQKLLDGATQGFIYFSLGSNVKSKDISEKTRDVLLQAFTALPYLVLWKFELEDLPGKPNNVIISKWFPQQDIFRHPNVKLFITQGGLQSIEEAVYNYIPVVGMPFFGDQPTNVNRIVYQGLGLSVDHTTVTKESFQRTILEVINDPRYRNKIKELANLARDQPMTGLERAVWWTEYVIRHKGTKHFRSPAMDLPLHQYLLLDVVGVCLLIVVISGYLLVKFVRLTCKILKNFKRKTKVKTR